MLEQMEWDNLAASEWKVLEGIHDVLQPFTQYTALIGGGSHPINHGDKPKFTGGKY